MRDVQPLARDSDPASEGLAVGVCELDRELRCLGLNRAMAALTRQPFAGHVGRSVREILPPGGAALESLCRQVLGSEQPIIDADVRIAGPEGR